MRLPFRTPIVVLCILLPALADEPLTLPVLPTEPPLTAVLYPVNSMMFAERISPSASYTVDPFGGGGNDPFAGPFADPNASAPAASDPTVALAEMANLPARSSLKYFPHFGRLMVRTTADGHQAMKALLADIDRPPVMVSVDFTFFSIPTNAVFAAEEFQRNGSLDEKTVLDLFRAGKAQVLAMTKTAALSGVNAQVEVVQEIIYPAEFQPPPAAKAGQAAAMVSANPGSFETREAGHILNVTATVAHDQKTVNLALLPESALLTGWVDYGAKADEKMAPVRRGPLSQPVFRCLNLTTSLVLQSGEPKVVLGAPDTESSDMIYAIVTARIVESKER